MYSSTGLLCLLGFFLVHNTSSSAVVDVGITKAIASSQSANVIVYMKDSSADVLSRTKRSIFASRTDRVISMSSALQKNAQGSQKSINTFLNASPRGITASSHTFESFWISNVICVNNASPETLQALQNRDDVARIITAPIIKTSPIKAESISSDGEVEWGVEKVRANYVWETTGYTGQHVVVANIDSGVRGSHEALKDNYVGKKAHGWFDPYTLSKSPIDENGHGTHTMGTIVGSHGIGVAPGAKWMACRGCDSDTCTSQALLACAQFILCPTDTNGKNADCSKAPQIVSNSWGGGQGEDWYQDAVDAWQVAGIIPVFANGNEGPECGTVSSPGDYANVLGVGATTIDDELAYFSSVGPSTTGVMKPDVSAPGYQIRSAFHQSDDHYETISGTSMATPHVSGVIALILSKNSLLKYDDIKATLTGTCSTETLIKTEETCGDDDELVLSFPNNAYGHGQVDAITAIESIEEDYIDWPVECEWDWDQLACTPMADCHWDWNWCGGCTPN